MTKKEVNVYTLSGMAKFKSFVKNGLDSSVMINVIVCFDSKFDEFRNRGFKFPPNLFFYHEISRSEVIGVLINEHKFTKEEAIDSLNKLVKEFNLGKIVRMDSDEAYETLVEQANARVVSREKNERLRIGEQDIIIIGGFVRDRINCVHVGDAGFEKTCEELKLNVIPLPKKDAEKENQLKEWMKKRVKD